MHQATETLEEKVARNLERVLTRATSAHLRPATQPSLPTAEVDLITLTLDELHDLVYLAASAINQTSSTMSKAHAQSLAGRAAALARSRASRHDGHHRGADPRA